MKIRYISGKMLKEALISAALTLTDMKKQVDELNVYPVPDGDTGTNMSLTMNNALMVLRTVSDDADVSEVAAKAASAMLRGARGNSGVITSLLFRGFSKGLKDKKTADCDDIANALEIGVASAYKAVMKPAEGTILTVARVSAEKAREASFVTNDPVSQWSDVCIAAKTALAKTPEQLPILKKAGVVDAGGKGLVIIFEEMLRAFRGEPRSLKPEPQSEPEGKYAFSVIDDDTKEITFGYCTEFIVNISGEGKNPGELRKYLEGIGDCVVVVDDEDIIKVHVHTDNPGLAIEKGLTYGSLCSIKIDNMRMQREKKAAAAKAVTEKPVPVPAKKRYGFVSVANGEGVASLFTDLGADCIVKGGQTMNPSADDILRAVYSVPAEIVFVLPNNKNIIMAAETAMKLSERTMCVIRTTSIPQGMSAMMSFDAEADLDTNRLAMSGAADKVQSGLITFAARDSSFSGHEIKAGDILALENGRLSFIDRDHSRAAYKLTRKLIKNLKGNAEFVTLLYGSEVDERSAAELADLIRNKFGSLDINLVNGGQPVYYYIISVEAGT